MFVNNCIQICKVKRPVELKLDILTWKISFTDHTLVNA